MNKQRPKYLNLFTIKLPLPGVVSILHRISGVLLFLFIPLVLYLLQISLASENGFNMAKSLMSGGFAKLVLLGLWWALLHHFLAGLRFLAMDMHFCIDLPKSRRAAMAIMAISIGSTLLMGVWLW